MRINTKYYVNEEYFETWSHNSAYIVGFLMADGYIRYGKLSFCLAVKDRVILDFIRNELSPNNIITYRSRFSKRENKTYDSIVLNISSTILSKSLLKMGFSNKKTGNEFIPEMPKEFIPDFIRGVFDGDGSAKSNLLGCCIASASKTFLEKIKNLCGNIGNISKSKNIFSFNMGIQDSIIFRNFIYNEGFSLKRKKDIIFSIQESKIKRYSEEEEKLIINGISPEGRSEGALRHIRRRLGVDLTPNKHEKWWTNKDVDFLLKNYKIKKTKWIADQLNRTVSSVKHKYSRLTKDKNAN